MSIDHTFVFFSWQRTLQIYLN